MNLNRRRECRHRNRSTSRGTVYGSGSIVLSFHVNPKSLHISTRNTIKSRNISSRKAPRPSSRPQAAQILPRTSGPETRYPMRRLRPQPSAPRKVTLTGRETSWLCLKSCVCFAVWLARLHVCTSICKQGKHRERGPSSSVVAVTLGLGLVGRGSPDHSRPPVWLGDVSSSVPPSHLVSGEVIWLMGDHGLERLHLSHSSWLYSLCAGPPALVVGCLAGPPPGTLCSLRRAAGSLPPSGMFLPARQAQSLRFPAAAGERGCLPPCDCCSDCCCCGRQRCLRV